MACNCGRIKQRNKPIGGKKSSLVGRNTENQIIQKNFGGFSSESDRKRKLAILRQQEKL